MSESEEQYLACVSPQAAGLDTAGVMGGQFVLCASNPGVTEVVRARARARVHFSVRARTCARTCVRACMHMSIHMSIHMPMHMPRSTVLIQVRGATRTRAAPIRIQ